MQMPRAFPLLPLCAERFELRRVWPLETYAEMYNPSSDRSNGQLSHPFARAYAFNMAKLERLDRGVSPPDDHDWVMIERGASGGYYVRSSTAGNKGRWNN